MAQLSCGASIGPRETVTLTSNLGPCDGVDAAIVVESAMLDLGGFTVSCADTDGNSDLPQGIILLGKKAKLMNGTIVGCSNGVGLGGKGKHTVQGVTVTNNSDDGLDILSDTAKNRILGSTATNNGSDGFYIRSDKNKLTDNVSTRNGEDGIDLPSTADKNKLTRNRCDDNEDSGVEVSGTKNKFILSSASSNSGTGLYIGGSKNKVNGGTSTGNGDYDVRGCAANKVKNLSATTPAPDCL